MKLVWASESLPTVFSKPWPVGSGKCDTKNANSRSQIPVTGQEYLIGVGCREVKVGERLPRMLKSYAPGTPMDMKCSLLWITILGVKVTEPNLTPSLHTYLDPQGALLGQQHLFWRGPGAWSVWLQVVLEMSGLEVLRREEQRCLMQVSLLLETDRAERDTEQLLRNSEIQLYSVSYSVPRICEHKKRNFSPLLINYYNKLQKTKKKKDTDPGNGQNIGSWWLTKWRTYKVKSTLLMYTFDSVWSPYQLKAWSWERKGNCK